jgi:hypothetical protein
MAAPGSLAQHAVEQAVLSMAKQLEDQLDSQLHKLENMNDDDLERLRQKRIDEMRKQQDQAREWAARGHGQYTEVMEEKQFFKEVKGEERVVAHFYRENWPCKVQGGASRRGRGDGGGGEGGRGKGARRQRCLLSRPAGQGPQSGRGGCKADHKLAVWLGHQAVCRYGRHWGALAGAWLGSGVSCTAPPRHAPHDAGSLPNPQVMDKHINLLCRKHLETKFFKVGPIEAG